MLKGISLCIPAVSILYFGQVTPSIALPYPFSLTPHYSTTFNNIVLSSTFTDFFMILLMLYHSLFLSLLPQVP
jgi:hypothetical protein